VLLLIHALLLLLLQLLWPLWHAGATHVFCVGCVLTGYHCSTTVQNHLSVASKYWGTYIMRNMQGESHWLFESLWPHPKT
jgi:hypothetical protein